MNIGDYIAITIILAVIALAVIYIVRQKKKGVKCIGCPHGNSCSGCAGDCGCSLNKNSN